MYTNCLADSCRKSVSTAPEFDCPFSLSITFQMITGSEVELHVKCFSEGAEKVGDKFGAMVGSDMFQNAVLGEHMQIGRAHV